MARLFLHSTIASWLVAGLACASATSTGCSSPAPEDRAAPSPAPAAPHSVDETRRVTIFGNTHPAARQPELDQGRVSDDLSLDHMQLVLKRPAAVESVLETRIDAIHDKTSPLYHQFMTADELGQQYGVADADIARVTSWLTSHGFRIDGIPVSKMFIEFSGTAGMVREAFQTEIHHLNVKGRQHIANTADPSIPAELTDVIVGVHALHDFMPHPMHQDRGQAKRDPQTGSWTLTNPTPGFTIVDGTDTYYALTPADFATVYDTTPLLNANTNGAGQTIVVVEDTNIKNVSDVATFRSAFGLPASTFTQVSPTGAATCSNPGVVAQAEGEAALDAEWAGAAAPGATIELASCADSILVFGGLSAVENIINQANPPKIISMSYGECESDNGNTANQNFVNAYQQAAALGISVFVSSGDEGAASCDADATYASHGIAVSGFASTPYNVAVGGTDFGDTYNAKESGPAVTTYWSASNSATFGSVLSYVPEIPWNDSCASSLVLKAEGATQAYGSTGFCNVSAGANFLTTGSGSGGPSTFQAQPTWQTGVVGLPTKSGGKRYLPDVSLFASNGIWNHFLVYCMTDTASQAGGGPCTYSNAADAVALAAGGTSFASPALAGIQALINQYTGSAQGNPAPNYYKLAAAEYGPRGSTRCNSSAGAPAAPVAPDAECIFHDVTMGDIDLPCTGTNCFGSSKSGRTTIYGALSTSTAALAPAYSAGVGWDYATGLGSIDANNLVKQW